MIILSVGTVGAAPPVVMATPMRAVLLADNLNKQNYTRPPKVTDVWCGFALTMEISWSTAVLSYIITVRG